MPDLKINFVQNVLYILKLLPKRKFWLLRSTHVDNCFKIQKIAVDSQDAKDLTAFPENQPGHWFVLETLRYDLCWSGLMHSFLIVLATIAHFSFFANSLLIPVKTSGPCKISPSTTPLRWGEKTRILYISSKSIPVVAKKSFQSFALHSIFFITLVDFTNNTFSKNENIFPVFSLIQSDFFVKCCVSDFFKSIGLPFPNIFFVVFFPNISGKMLWKCLEEVLCIHHFLSYGVDLLF